MQTIGKVVQRCFQDANKSRLPIWLLALALSGVLAAFSQRSLPPSDAQRLARLPLDLDSLAPTGAGYSSSHRSNRAFELLQFENGRFYALYGPPPAVGDSFDHYPASPTQELLASQPPLAGLLVGDVEATDRSQRGRYPSASRNVHDFSLEAGPLRIAVQEGRYAPGRFVEATAVAPAALGQPGVSSFAGRFTGRLSDLTGSWATELQVAADGSFRLLNGAHCNAAGKAQAASDGRLWQVQAAFGPGCGHAGETLQGHAWQRGDTVYLVLPSDDLDSGAVFTGRQVSSLSSAAQ